MRVVWSFLHKLGSPRWFYRISSQWLPWLAVLAGGMLVWGCVWGLAYAPPDAVQGNSFRIIYIHVPAAFVSLAGYYAMAAAGVVSLVWKIKIADIALRAGAGVGAAMTFCALVTGSIWGKPTWGTWWVWDARITSMLVLLFLYLGVLALYEAFENRETATIKLTRAPSMHPDMFHPLIVTILGFYVLYVVLLLMRMRAEVLEREQKSRWVEDVAIGRTPAAESGG
jgi:heme exporter protein C